jgi:general secretion pathway protein G
MSAVAWKPNGEKCPVTNVVDGSGVVVRYNEDGTENRRETYKDGKLNRKEELAKNWVNGPGKSLLTMYYLRVGTFPKSIDELMSPADGKTAFVQRAEDIQSPWGKPYQYKQPGDHNPGSFDLWATTPEGKQIGNWDD